DDENRTGAAASRVRDVVDHAWDWKPMEVAAAHRDDGAEAAVECAAARGLEDIDLTAEKRIPGQYPRLAPWRCNGTALDGCDRPRPVLPEAAAVPVIQPVNLRERSARLQGTHEIPKRQLPFAAHD